MQYGWCRHELDSCVLAAAAGYAIDRRSMRPRTRQFQSIAGRTAEPRGRAGTRVGLINCFNLLWSPWHPSVPPSMPQRLRGALDVLIIDCSNYELITLDRTVVPRKSIRSNEVNGYAAWDQNTPLKPIAIATMRVGLSMPSVFHSKAISFDALQVQKETR